MVFNMRVLEHSNGTQRFQIFIGDHIDTPRWVDVKIHRYGEWEIVDGEVQIIVPSDKPKRAKKSH